MICPQGVYREPRELLESSGQPDAPGLFGVPHALAALELICDAKQEGEQHFVRLNDGKVLSCIVLYCVAASQLGWCWKGCRKAEVAPIQSCLAGTRERRQRI